ncbi:MAG: hypothetical protein ABR972_08395 [Acidimicrobiales bacterium]
MSLDNFGFGDCRAKVDSQLTSHCSQVAVNASGLCRYHEKLYLGLTVGYVPESLSTIIRKRTKP